MSIGTGINLVLDPLFIFTFGMGIGGAALATLVAMLFSCVVYSYIAFVKRRLFTRFRSRLLVPGRAWIRLIGTVGLPAAGNQLVIALGMGLTNRVLAEFGQIAVAGYGAGSKVDMIVVLPVLGLASASVTVVGMFAGAGRSDLVRSTAVYTFRLAVTAAVVFGLGVYLGARPIVGLFTDDPYALTVGCQYLGYMVFAYPLMAFGITAGRLLQGIGYGMPALIISALRVVVIAVPTAYAAVYLFGAPIQSVWISYIGAGLISNVLAFLWIRAYIWKRDPSLRAAQTQSG